MASSESDIQKSGLALCKAHPLVAWISRANSGKVKVRGGFCQLHENGTPDTIGYTTGALFVGIEYKTVAAWNSKNHGATEEQIKHLNDIKNAGGLCGIACCDKHVIDILDGKHIGMSE